MGTGFLKRKKEAKAMQAQFAEMQSKMDTLEAEGTAGNGLVSITLLGNGSVKQVRIKPECIDKDDADGLQDLIKAAFNDAKKKLDDQSMQGMKGFPGMPGF
jgi:DNA-binding YbaB/EbfC family protein